ncbi:MAG TPA: hypothetical protein VHB20_17500 [Verrucomicrobiae bacterium]|nr:hypothetical protein [Verrucomicrobiae bacterium]
MRAITLSLLAATLLSWGCESPVSVRTNVSEADFRAYGGPGAQVIAGDIPKYSAVPIHLDPATPYANDFYRALARRTVFATSNETNTVALHPVMLEHRRTALSDTNGYFAFEHVSPGQYYVSWFDAFADYHARVVHAEGPPYGIGITQQFSFVAPRGKWRVKEITVREGESFSKLDF